MENIVQYSTLADDEIVERSKQQYEQIKKIDKDKLMDIFSEQSWIIILNHFQNRQIESGQDILDIIEMIVEQVGQQIFKSAKLSVHLKQFKILIKEKMDSEQKENKYEPFSEIIEQMLRIYQKIMKDREIDSEMKLIIASVTKKRNQYIFGSNTQTENEKEIKANSVYEEMKKKDLNELQRIFNEQMFSEIMNRIENCTTRTEQTILDIILYVANKGEQKDNCNIFFNAIQKSQLKLKIEQLIIEQEVLCEKQDENQLKSGTITKLIIIYLIIMNGQLIQIQILQSCTNLIGKNISQLLIKLNEYGQEKDQINIIEQEIMENELVQTTNLIRTLKQFKAKNFKGLIFIPKQLNELIRKKLTSLLHINCPSILHCKNCIPIYISSKIQELEQAAFEIAITQAQNNRKFFKQLIFENHICSHIDLLYSSLISSNQLQSSQKTLVLYQYSSKQSTLSTLINFLNHLSNYFLSVENIKHIIKVPNLISYLIKIFKFIIYNDFNQSLYQEQQLQIRKYCKECLNQIRNNGHTNELTQLAQEGYVEALTIAIGLCGGCIVENNKDIQGTLNSIRKFFDVLYQGRQCTFLPQRIYTLLPKPKLICQSFEQIEEQGGLEELESHLFNSRIKYNYCFKHEVMNTKRTIQNAFQNLMDTHRWF